MTTGNRKNPENTTDPVKSREHSGFFHGEFRSAAAQPEQCYVFVVPDRPGDTPVGALIVSPLGIDAEIRALYGLCLPSFPLFRAVNRTNSRKSRRNVRTNTPRFCLMHVVNLATGSAGANRRKQGADNVLR